MSDLINKEKISKVANSPVLTYKNASMFKHISLLKQWFTAYNVGLNI